jgi:hypothetical protein
MGTGRPKIRVGAVMWIAGPVQYLIAQDDRTMQLLVRGVQEPGVIRLGETLALVTPRARWVRQISRGRPPR